MDTSRFSIPDERPEDNLKRIFEDSLKYQQGKIIINHYLEKLLPDSRLTLLLFDLDSSKQVRERGIEAKIALVKQAQQLVKNLVEPRYRCIECGTRDEIFVVLPNTRLEEAVELAETLRKSVENHLFVLDMASGESVKLTVSIGLVEAPTLGLNASDLTWAASEALQEAKKKRNCVHVLKEIPTNSCPVLFSSRDLARLSMLSEHFGRTEESLIHEALSRLFDKHKGLWYWGVEKWDFYNQGDELFNSSSKDF